MKDRKSKSFTYRFESSRSPEEIFELLLDIDQWWSGLFEETITGKSQKINDEFSFKAGGGQHNTKQKLIELAPNKKITWLVTESNLSFLEDTNEWDGTKIGFDLSSTSNTTKVTFTHQGLVPEFECYNECTGAWSQYMQNLEAKLK